MEALHAQLAFIGNIGPVQWIIIGVVGLLIFGKRLPQVGKSLGQGIVEFKKGLQGMNDEIESATKNADASSNPQQLDQDAHSSANAAGPTVTEKRDATPTSSSTSNPA